MSETDLLYSVLEVLIVSVLAVVVPPLTYHVYALIVRIFAYFRSLFDSKELEILDGIVALFIKSAEQQGFKDEAMRLGAAKKEYVISRVTEYLVSKKIKISPHVIADAIEAGIRKGYAERSTTP